MGAAKGRMGPGAPRPFSDYDSSLASWTFLAAHPRDLIAHGSEDRGAVHPIVREIDERGVGPIERVRLRHHVEMRDRAASRRNSSPSARVFAVTLRSCRSWNRWRS